MSEIMHSNPISLAVWDVPMPVVAGEMFSIKAGAKSASGHSLAGHRVEVFDAAGVVVASGNLGETPLAGTEALYWTAIDVPAPATGQVTEYAVRFIPGPGHDATATRFSVAIAGKARAQAERQSHGARHRRGAGRRRNPARPVSRPHRCGRPRRAARLQGRVSASPLAHRAYRAAPADPYRRRRERRADDGACARGAPRRALGEITTLGEPSALSLPLRGRAAERRR